MEGEGGTRGRSKFFVASCTHWLSKPKLDFQLPIATSSITADRLSSVGRICLRLVLATLRSTSSHHFLAYAFRRKQSLMMCPSSIFHPLAHGHKHHPSIVRLRSRVSHHPIGKKATSLALWINSIRPLRRNRRRSISQYESHSYIITSLRIPRSHLPAQSRQSKPPTQKQRAKQHERSLLPPPLPQQPLPLP
jgi:hypothetical protein